jgi:hypothetical protein
MKLSTLLFLALGVASLGVVGWVFWRATVETRQWNELLSLPGKDPVGPVTAEASRRESLARTFLPGGGEQEFQLFQVLCLKGPGSSSRIVQVWHNLRVVPGNCPLRIYVLNESRRLLSSTSMEGGGRSGLLSVRPVARPELGPWVFTIDNDFELQYFVLVGDAPVLVRLENDSGALVQNDFEVPESTLGPTPPIRSPEEWESALSGGPVETLRTLMWLGGAHASPPLALRRPGVVRKISDLRNSPNPWVAEAAKAVPLDRR